jgi:2-methylisocitrate lyase-like PEP mutase family enzyme
MGAGGRLETLDFVGIGRLGMRIAIYPGLARAAAGYAIGEALTALRNDGNLSAMDGRLFGLKEYNEALKLAEIEEWENKYLK